MTADIQAGAPLIPDFPTGANYLASLPLANPAVAEQKLIHFLDALLDKPLSAQDTFTLLEQARLQISFVEDEMARRYHVKPLPLSEEEEAVFQQVIGAWERLEQAYALCARLEAPDHNSPNYARLIATLLHRCLHCKGMVILEHYRARRELPVGVWLDFHGYYETAEEWGVATTPVVDELENVVQSSHCMAAYVTPLLLDIASAYSHSVRNINLIRRWAGMWAPLVSVHVLEDDEELPPYLIELMKDAPLHQTGSSHVPGEDARYLDTTRLGLQVNHMLGQLHQRMTPSQLGLGEETSSLAVQLLTRLSKPWTQSSSPRKFRRFPAAGTVQVAIGFDAMHFHVSKKSFEQPDSAEAYSRSDFDRLFTFRDQANPAQELTIRPHLDFPLDEWSVINHSANGFRLARSCAGARVGHGQLMAVRPHDGEHFLLCRTSWLMQEFDASLMAGVSVIPGMPVAVGVRHLESSERFVQAFLMPVLPAIKEEGSLVVPSGMFLPRKVMAVHVEGETMQLRMRKVIERGLDYERISYEPA